MEVTILYFASLRENLGTDREVIILPADVRSARDLREHLCARGGSWQRALGTGSAARVAVNQQLASEQTEIGDGAEVAFFPPVTGG